MHMIPEDYYLSEDQLTESVSGALSQLSCLQIISERHYLVSHVNLCH